MNILIDIGHPAHVHLYRNFYFESKKKGHRLYVTVKDISSARRLLDLYNIPYSVIGKKGTSKLGKLFQQLWFDLQLLVIVLRRGIDIGLGSSITNTHISKITRMQSIVFDDDDDEVQPLFVKFAHPFASALLSPDILEGKRSRMDTIYYPSYHELAYLHPERFTPDPSVLAKSGLAPGEPYFILRFNEFVAHHDYNVTGLTVEQKQILIDILLPHGKVFLTTESESETIFDNYRIKIDPTEIHSFLYYAKMFLGDSQTMTSEAGVLGTPAIRCNSLANSLSYLQEQEEKYELSFGYRPEEFDKLILKVKELLGNSSLDKEWNEKRLLLLNDKFDLSGFMLWFVENYPSSKEYGTNNKVFKT